MQDYSLSQIKNMQSQAAERVREMQRRAKNKVEQHNASLHRQLPPMQNKSAPPLKLPIDIKSLLGGDSDRALLLTLILLLSQDGECDKMLILALVYIML